jgi:vacuolar-type H+-ATPase subunit H
MFKMDTFKEIREIEKESEDIISEAETIKEQVIASARKEAEKKFLESSEEIKKLIEEETGKMGSEADAARQKVLNANRKKIEALKESASANKDQAVQIVLKKFERMFE